MFDFVEIKTRIANARSSKIEVYPEFIVKRSKDLMVRGKFFYAIWDEDNELWRKDEDFVAKKIDEEIKKRVLEEQNNRTDSEMVKGVYLKDFSSNKWSEWQKYIKSLPDNFHELDTTIAFANTKVKKTDYISKRLSYDLVDGDYSAYDELMNVLYAADERKKLEWAIGAIISGASKHIQKFIVLYGPPKSGKSTFLKIVQKLFEGYYSTFEAKALGSVNNPFALEAFKDNPLLVIQHDGDLSKIEDNTKLNQIISHEELIVNEKYKSTYATSFNSFLMLGTNKPVKISDAKSGIIRRLIDVEPTGETVSYNKYQMLMKKIEFELGAIAHHCLKVYTEMGENYYDSYKSFKMIGATNAVYNFLEEKYLDYKNRDCISLAEIWNDYKSYCEDSNQYKMSKTSFKEELMSYFKEFKDHTKLASNVYSGFKTEKFIRNDNEELDFMPYKLQFNKRVSDFDEIAKENKFLAQYAKEDGTPEKRWDEVKTTLCEIDSHKLHYICLPKNHIVIDFDIKDEDGNKDFEKNLEAASNWPPTYAEVSKSGSGIHLHYIYDGDVSQLKNIYDENPNIEIKVFTGKSALRRKLTKCNDMPIATINSGLPLKRGKNMINVKEVKDERHLRNLVAKNLRKEIHPGTKPSVDFIKTILDDAYKSGVTYDLSDMENDVFLFASNSSNHANYCMNLVDKIHFKSKDVEDEIMKNETIDEEEKPIAFFDVEVFPNVFILCWKYAGENVSVTKLINPKPEIVAQLFENYWMIGFNNRNYDNHICWYWIQGYTNQGLYDISQRIITKNDSSAKAWQAYSISYSDVYDFSNTKQSLKKWEIALGISHLENAYPWDQNLDEKHWDEVANYCAWDVAATEKVFNHLKEDWTARKILAILSGLTVNDTTNSHTTKIIVGDEKEPWHEFEYTDLSKMFPGYEYDEKGIDKSRYTDPEKVVRGKSIYMGEDPGEGGYVYAEPGIYRHVALLDIASMHPTSALNMNIFGPYTKRYKAIVDARLAIKHKDYQAALKCLLKINPNVEDELKLYLSDSNNTKSMAYALKIPINSVYGLTSASFQNKLKDPRNVDNIVAKRGALFMINLKNEVRKKGFKIIIPDDNESNICTQHTVAHIKTDSIKIPEATQDIIDFVVDYGKKYGYTFEHEATYDRMCLVNDAVYVAKYEDGMHEFQLPTGEKILTEWTATGKEFQIPYVFKTLFSKEKVKFTDLCQTINVKEGSLYLDDGSEEMKFVGKVGSFVPIKKDCGGYPLFRVKDGKKYAAPGTKDYEWLEAEYVKNVYKENDIDMKYFENMAQNAIDHINEFGNFERFINDPNYDPQLEKIVNVPTEIKEDEIPFDSPYITNCIA